MSEETKKQVQKVVNKVAKVCNKHFNRVQKAISDRDIKEASLKNKCDAMEKLHRITNLEEGKPTDILGEVKVNVNLTSEEDERS